MTYKLANNNVEIYIDHPLTNYNFSRFDWSGKIVEVMYNGISMASSERNDGINENQFGKGYYNEFGIDSPLGFQEAKIGEWFHKIGVGLLQKTSEQYDFMHNYTIRPARFDVLKQDNKIVITCISSLENGYAYALEKEIELAPEGFRISYLLKNTGEKQIKTTEYVHNFMSIDNDLIGENYVLKFPFELEPGVSGEVVNPEGSVVIQDAEVKFLSIPNEQFFYSHIDGTKAVSAKWELKNLKSKKGISETGNFRPARINLWGWKHVISPEIFHEISLPPRKSVEWTRNYEVFILD